ncbi:retrotransposon protein, putative, ty1-copia subclass [Tanacetum coccineum]
MDLMSSPEKMEFAEKDGDVGCGIERKEMKEACRLRWEYGEVFLESECEREGRGVKEKEVGSVDGSGSRLGDGTSSKNTSSIQEEFMVTLEPMQSNVNVEVESDVGPMVGQPPTDNTHGKSSYVNVVGAPSRKDLNFLTLFTRGGNGVDRVAYPVVGNYVRNTWGKYGLINSMLDSSTGILSFPFGSMDGLDAMLENGPWFIRNNSLILKKWNPNVNLMKEDVGNVLVWVKLHGIPVTAFSEDSFSAISTRLGTPLMLDSYTSDMCIQSWGRSSYARALIEVPDNVELKDIIVVAMPKFDGEGFYTCNVRVEYEWKPPRCACCKVFGHVQDGCHKNIDSDEVKNMKKPSQTPKGVLVDLGTNGGTSNLVSKKANSSGSSLWNIECSNTSDHDSEDEVASVDNDMEKNLASKKDGYGNNSLLKQWKESYENGDYDFDPDNDDMYEGQDIPDRIQDICDNFDIKVRGRKKK